MKLLGYLLMTICLCTGCIAATTAYLPKLGASDRLVDQQVKSPAGVLTDAAGAPVTAAGSETPIALFDPSQGLRRHAPGEDPPYTLDTSYANAEIEDEAQRLATITPELATALRDGGVSRVHVKSFSFARWDFLTGWGLFAVSVAGLFGGAMMVRKATQAQIAASAAAAEAAASEETPEGAMGAIRASLQRLLDELEPVTDERERLDLIIEHAGVIQREHAATVPEGRATLIGKLGLGGYAQFMDRFSAFERQLNRSWSAAADGALPESEEALAAAWEALPEAEQRMGLTHDEATV